MLGFCRAFLTISVPSTFKCYTLGKGMNIYLGAFPITNIKTAKSSVYNIN